MTDHRVADYRRAIRYMLTPLYYLSVLHSIVARIDIRRHLAETQDGDTNKDSIPLTATEPGEISTIHIDPKRGKDTVVIEARSRGGVAQVVCLRTSIRSRPLVRWLWKSLGAD